MLFFLNYKEGKTEHSRDRSTGEATTSYNKRNKMEELLRLKPEINEMEKIVRENI